MIIITSISINIIIITIIIIIAISIIAISIKAVWEFPMNVVSDVVQIINNIIFTKKTC